LSEQTRRWVAEGLAQSAQSARPHQAQTATASEWCVAHFMAFDGRREAASGSAGMQTGIFFSSNN